MQIDWLRFESDADATMSIVLVDGKPQCYGLEDERRAKKVRGETRIPAGLYHVRLRTWGGFHERYSKDRRFKDFHRGMLEVCHVTHFDDILIHVGNDDDDTAGCLLPGETRAPRGEPMLIGQSAVAYSNLYRKVVDAAERRELTIRIVDAD